MTVSGASSEILIDHLTTAVLLFDRDLRLKGINASAEDLLSVSHRKVIGLDVEQILPNSFFFSEAVKRSFSDGSPCVQWAADIDLPNMKTITVDCVFTPIDNGQGVDCLVVEMMNTYFHKRISKEETLIAQNLTSNELSRALAHEIKNPLGGLRGAAQLLRQELVSDDLKEYTDIIINEADRLRNLVDRMLSPDKEMNFSTENIHEILEYVCSLISAETTINFNLVRDYDPSLPEIWTDRESMIQIFLNIIRNSIQAIEEEGEITIQTRAERKCTIAQVLHKLCLRIDVIDNGSGILDDMVDRIFYPMITSRAEGTGLGLPIAQSLIQKHGGIIEYNRVNERTVFTILLPRERNHD